MFLQVDALHFAREDSFPLMLFGREHLNSKWICLLSYGNPFTTHTLLSGVMFIVSICSGTSREPQSPHTQLLFISILGGEMCG